VKDFTEQMEQESDKENEIDNVFKHYLPRWDVYF